MKGYSTFPKLLNWSLTIRWFSIISRTHFCGGGCLTPHQKPEMQSAYSTSPHEPTRLRKEKNDQMKLLDNEKTNKRKNKQTNTEKKKKRKRKENKYDVKKREKIDAKPSIVFL